MLSTEQKISRHASASPPTLVFDKKTWGGSRRNWNVPAGSIIFFVSLYLYVWLFIEPRLIYHSFGTFIAYPAFSVGWQFLKSSLNHPGGVVEYIGGFLSQLYYFSWLGALIITTVAWLMYLAAKILVRQFSLRRPPGYGGQAGQTLELICYIPAIMLLMIHSRYDSHLTTFLSLLAVLWFSAGYVMMAVRPLRARLVVFLAEFYLLYYIASGASFVFAFLATIYEIFVGTTAGPTPGRAGQRNTLKILFPAAAIGTYLIARYVFDSEITFIYLPSLWQLTYPSWVINVIICFYFFFPLLLFATGLWGWLAMKKASIGKSTSHSADKPKMRDKHKPPAAKKPWRLFKNNPLWDGLRHKVKWTIETASPVVILLVSIFVSFDNAKKKLVEVDYFAYKQMWPEVLQTARQIQPKSYDICYIHDVDQALYYTGQLGDEMFYYPQDIISLTLFNAEGKSPAGRIFLKRSRLFLKLGHISSAEKDAFEYLEIVGNNPLILEQLATIKLVKGQLEAAKVFINALSKDLIFGHHGQEMLRHLQEDPALANNERIQQLRSTASDTESISDTLDDEFFTQLLNKNKNNKMAFEYMMAFYLLSGQVEKIVANINRAYDFGYEKLPQYYEEAIVVYMANLKKPVLPKNVRLPQREIIERAKTIGKLYNFYRGNEQTIRKALGPDSANSYFLYYLFGVSREKV